MSNSKILNDIISEAIEKITLQKHEISDETDLAKDLQMDSLDMVELYTSLEEKFDIRVNDEEMSNCGTKVKDIKELLKKYIKD